MSQLIAGCLPTWQFMFLYTHTCCLVNMAPLNTVWRVCDVGAWLLFRLAWHDIDPWGTPEGCCSGLQDLAFKSTLALSQMPLSSLWHLPGSPTVSLFGSLLSGGDLFPLYCHYLCCDTCWITSTELIWKYATVWWLLSSLLTLSVMWHLLCYQLVRKSAVRQWFVSSLLSLFVLWHFLGTPTLSLLGSQLSGGDSSPLYCHYLCCDPWCVTKTSY